MVSWDITYHIEQICDLMRKEGIKEFEQENGEFICKITKEQ